MAKKIPVDDLAQLLVNVTLRPYEHSLNTNVEEKWIILCSIIQGLDCSMPKNLLVKAGNAGALLNFSALAALNKSMLIELFNTPDVLYTSIQDIIFDGFKELVGSEYFKDIYHVEDCD